MKEKWFKYLSEQNNEELIPIMENFFNDTIDFDELNNEVDKLDLLNFRKFNKDTIINDILKGDL